MYSFDALIREQLKHLNMPSRDREVLIEMFNTLLTDLTATKADLTALRTSITGITAKLDLDAGVTDTNYAALHDPAALTLGPTLQA